MIFGAYDLLGLRFAPRIRDLDRQRLYRHGTPPPAYPTTNIPLTPVAAFATFLTAHTRRLDGPEHGMAYDVQRFNEITKQMSAYAHYARRGHLEHAAARARRRRRLDELADELNARLQFRFDQDSGAPLRRASELLDSEHPAHRTAGRVLYARAQREAQLAERDTRLLRGEHPGSGDGRWRAACTHAERWSLPLPEVLTS